MGRRVFAILALLLLATACSGDDSGDDQPGRGRTTNADCAVRIPTAVFDTLRWSPPKDAEETVRGCHRETEQGYVEVRDQKADYDKLCSTLDRRGGTRPGSPADWLPGVTACAVEPTNGVGSTKVLVRTSATLVTTVTVVANTSTDQADVRSAVAKLVDLG
jgi:hypothetical protein